MTNQELTGRRKRSWPRRMGVFALVAAVLLGIAAFVCRAMIGWVFPIGSGSMEPTIMTGESVFLQYSSEIPGRWAVVAFRDPGGGASIKRVVGLPLEGVTINESGDLRIGDEYVPSGDGRPGPVVIFDSKLQSIDEHWRHGGTTFDPWTVEPGRKPGESEVFTLDGDLVDRRSDKGLLRFQDRVTDGRLTDDGQYEMGPNVVHDVVVEFEVKVLSAGGTIRVQVSEEDDWFAAYIPVYVGEEASKTLLKWNRPSRFVDKGSSPFFGSLDTVVPLGEWVTIRLANIDNEVTLSVGDATFAGNYPENTPRLNPMGSDDVPFSAGERVKIGGNGLDLQLRNVRVLRDIFILPRGKFGVGRRITLGEDEFFALGDNTSNSRDSRERGPIPLKWLIGTAKAVVRPLAAARKL